MKKSLYVAVAVVAALGLIASVAGASVPDPANSIVQWRNLIPGWVGATSDPETVAVFIAPLGQGHAGLTDPTQQSYLEVWVRDQFNAAMGGVQVDATFDGDSLLLSAPGNVVTGFTDGSGYVKLVPTGSVIREIFGIRDAEESGLEITCLGVSLYQNQTPFLSPDMTSNPPTEPIGCVGGLDFAILAADWLSFNPACRSNLNRKCNEAGGQCVGGLDYAPFAQHWLEGCP
jgi:hypothetical protein